MARHATVPPCARAYLSAAVGAAGAASGAAGRRRVAARAHSRPWRRGGAVKETALCVRVLV